LGSGNIAAAGRSGAERRRPIGFDKFPSGPYSGLLEIMQPKRVHSQVTFELP
jgi:hypothetical protein